MKLDRIIAVRNNRTVYHDGELCLKMFDRGCKKTDIFAEAQIQVQIEETGLNVPAVREVSYIDCRWTIVTDYIKGKTLDRILKDGLQNEKEQMSVFASLQLEIHKKSCAGIDLQAAVTADRIRRSGLDATVTERLIALLDGASSHMGLCHGDFNPSNIIISESGTPYILDWASAAMGCTLIDSAQTYLLLYHDYGRQLAEEYIAAYGKAADVSEKDIISLLPVAAASSMASANSEKRAFLSNYL